MFLKITGQVNGNPETALFKLRVCLENKFPQLRIMLIPTAVYGDCTVMVEVFEDSIFDLGSNEDIEHAFDSLGELFEKVMFVSRNNTGEATEP